MAASLLVVELTVDWLMAGVMNAKPSRQLLEPSHPVIVCWNIADIHTQSRDKHLLQVTDQPVPYQLIEFLTMVG